MLRTTIAALSSLLLSPPAAFAQDTCSSGRSDIFSVENFETNKTEAGYMSAMQLDITLRNSSGDGVRMIDGSLIFQDVLGRDILRIGISPDLKINAGETALQTGNYSNLRLLEVNPEDVVITTCVRGLVYSDGEVFKVAE